MVDISGIEVQIKSARQAESDANRLDSALGRLGKSGTKAEGSFDRLRRETSKMGGGFEGLKRQIFSLQGALATLGVGISFGAAVNEIAAFGREMSVVQAVSRASEADMKRLTATARELGATTGFSASEAAQGLVALSQAGFSAEQSLAAIRDTLNLAAAGGIGLGEAADLATNTLSQFNLAANEAGRVADVLAESAARSNTTVGQLGIAMRQVGPVAASVGVSFENTTAAISALSDAGLKGEQAGTGLRAVLASLVDPTKEAAGVIERLGVNVSDLSDPAQVFEQFGKAGMTAQDAVKIFGREAAAAGLILAGASDKVAELADEFRNAGGAAAKMAKDIEDNLQGDIKTLSSAMSDLILQTGEEGLTGALRSATQAFTGLIRAASGATTFTEFRDEFALFADTTSILAVAIGSRLVASLGAATVSMGAATTAATVLRGALALLGGPVGIVLTVAGTLAILATRESETEKQARLAGAAHDELKKALDLVNESTGEARQAAIDHAISLGDQKIRALESAEAQLKLVEAQIKGVESLAAWEKLKGAGDTGPIKAEAAALRAEVEKLQSGIDELRNSSSLLTITVEGASSEMGHLDDRAAAVLKTMQKNTKATDENGKATSKAAVETDKFADSFQSLLESLDPAVRAEREFQERTDLLNRALKEGKLTLAEYNKFLGLTFEGYNDVAGGAEEVAKAIDKSTDAAVVFTKEADPFADAWNRSIEDVSRAISDGLVGGFKDAASTIKSIFSSLLSSLVNLSIRNKILIPMGLAPGSAMAGGFGGGGFNPGSLFGLSGGPTTVGASPISPMAAGGLPGGGASSLPFSGSASFLNNSTFATNPLSAGLQGFGGNMAGNLIFGSDRGMGANIGGTLGAIAGSFLPIPGGTLIGSFLGNAVGGLFGGGGKSSQAQGGSINLATGERQISGLTGEKFSQENADLRTNILNQAQQFSEVLSQVAGEAIQGSIGVVVNSRRGLELYAEGTKNNFGNDVDALLEAAFDSIIRQSDSFSADLEKSLINFEGGAQQAIQVLGAFQGSLTALQQAANPAESIGPFEASLRQLQAIFDGGAAAAKRLGMDVDDMQDNLRQAARNLRDSFNTDIQAAILAITDPAQAEIAALEQRRDALLKEADAINASTGAVNRLIDLQVGKVLERQAMEAEQAREELARVAQQAQQEAQRQAEERQRQIDQLTKQFDTAMQPVTDFLRESASTAFASSQRSLVQVMQDQFNAAMSLTRAYDGSIDSLTAMSGAVRDFRNTELQLLQQIDQAQQSIASSFSSTIEQITVAGLRSEEQRFNFFKSQAESLAKALGSLTDPSEIARVSQEINRLTGSAFGQLGTDEQRQALSGQFAGFLRNVQGLAEERLEIAQRDVVDRGQAIQTAIEASMGRVVVKFETAAKQQEDAARVSLQAAREALQAARTPVRVEVAPVRVKLEAANDEVGGSR